MSVTQDQKKEVTKSGGALTFFFVLLSMVFFFGGLVLMGYAFSYPDIALWMFVGGLLSCCLGCYLAFDLIHSIDGEQAQG